MDVRSKVFVGRGSGSPGWDSGTGRYVYLVYLPASAGDGKNGGWRVMRPRPSGLKDTADLVAVASRCRQLMDSGRYTAVGAVASSLPMPAPGEALKPGQCCAWGVCWLITPPELDDAYGVCEAVHGWDSLYSQLCQHWRHVVLDPFDPSTAEKNDEATAEVPAGVPAAGHPESIPAAP